MNKLQMEQNLEHFSCHNKFAEEVVLASINCQHEGNPFLGTLILTNMRLIFVRQAELGQQKITYWLKNMTSASFDTMDHRSEMKICFADGHLNIVRLERGNSQQNELFFLATKQAIEKVRKVETGHNWPRQLPQKTKRDSTKSDILLLQNLVSQSLELADSNNLLTVGIKLSEAEQLLTKYIQQ